MIKGPSISGPPHFSVRGNLSYTSQDEGIIRNMLTYFHRTTADKAASILGDGFRDRKDFYGTEIELCGVWLSDRPLDGNDGANGDTLLIIRFASMPAEFDEKYELVEDGKPYREWCVPASIVNSIASIERAPETDV